MIDRRRLALSLASLALAGLPVRQAHGRRRLRFHGQGMGGRGPYGPGVLTVDDLKECLRSTARINSDMDALDREERMLGAVPVNSYDPASVARYNASVDVFNERVGALNAAVDRFNNSCAGKRYYEADMKQAEEQTGLRR